MCEFVCVFGTKATVRHTAQKGGFTVREKSFQKAIVAFMVFLGACGEESDERKPM